ncbi:hypothetical protein ACFOSC_03335 [Streptantibioticus rubrisoli]|uniref:HEAT repeat domain-containing protein n=1 Tax=Streptantibioticus rubrisoli TaxID=1387313 RepID=A0ABT1PF81_9ACTN|nr:hypothetical protein [Streptantibioticus rubrisoli]MCQ4042883.1 hypothetical protein [Streptantibioticus rubrisoli]
MEDVGRWRRLCLAASTGSHAAVRSLFTELRTVDEHGSVEDRKAALDELVRAAPRIWLDLDRYARSPHGVTGAHPTDDSDPLHLVLASFDRDGRIRQAAVERLARRSGRYVASALALRTDDWVPAVRERAVTALLGHVAPDEAAAAVRLLARLDRRRRAAGVLESYRAALSVPERRRTVRRLAAESDPHARRFGVELALELGEYVRGDLARTALHDRDQVCRTLCAARLLELDPDQAGRLMWARSAAVRELAVAALPDDVPSARLVGPLADRSRMVRAQARWKLYKRGEPPVDVYRRQLRRCGRATQPRLVAGLAAGLGECGDSSDLPMLQVLAADTTWAPVARRAAVRALGRLAQPPERVAVLAPLVGDVSPSVARETLDVLAAAECATPQALAAGLARPETPVWKAALRAARTLAHWDRLEFVLRAAADPRPPVAERARAESRRWTHARWPGGAADPAQLRLIGGLLRQASLPEPDRAGVEWVLRSAARVSRLP